MNGNGFFDAAELGTVDQLPEAYLDENEDGSFDATEPFFDIDGDGQYSDLAAPSAFLFNGALCTAAAKLSLHCGQLVHVRASQTLVASTSSALISILSVGPLDLAGGSQAVSARVTDLNGNSPAGGSIVAFSASAGTLSGQTSFTVPDQTGPYSTPSVTLTQTAAGTAATGFLTVSVTAPSGLTTSSQATVVNAAAP